MDMNVDVKNKSILIVHANFSKIEASVDDIMSMSQIVVDVDADVDL